MRKHLILYLMCLFLASIAFAENTANPMETASEASQQPAVPDSLMRVMSKQVQREFDFSDTDTLADVAGALGIENMAKWKEYLGLEPQNPALDKRSLRSLGIPPYNAYLGKQFCLHGFTEQYRLAEIASKQSIPIKKLRQILNIATLDRSRDNNSLQALGFSVTHLDSLITEF